MFGGKGGMKSNRKGNSPCGTDKGGKGNHHGKGKGRRSIVVGSSTAEQVAWLKRKTEKLENHHWDASQFLYELVGDGGAAYNSCFVNIGDDPRGFRILETMVPALSERDVREALEGSQANLAFMPLLGTATARAWSRVAENATSETLSHKLRRDKILSTLRVLFHLLGLDPLKFWVLEAACTNITEAVSNDLECDLEIKDVASSVRVRLDAAVRRERAADEAAAAEEDATAAAAERAHDGRRFGTAGVSTDAQLEEVAILWRGVPPYPTAEDFPSLGGVNIRGAALAPNNNAAAAAEEEEVGGGGGMVPTLIQRPVTPHNRARGGFPSLGAYLGTHFTMLREDCLAALRPALRQLLLRDAGGGVAPQERGSCPIYINVRAVTVSLTRRSVGWRLRFEPAGRRGGGGRAKRLTIGPRSLMTGSLLCLIAPAAEVTAAEDRLIFATIIQRDERLLTHRDGPFVDMEEVVPPNGGLPRFDPGMTYMMIESPAYFEAYRPVLEALQSFPDDDTGLPFSQLLLGGSGATVSPPAYLLRDGGKRLELGSVYEGALPWGVGDDTWPTGAPSLNDSQLQAIQMALRSRMALIQGPPGTGKTYVGVLVSRILIANAQLFDDRPIIFVCYTNHALDQLLGHLIPFAGGKIVRIGGRSQCEELEPFMLKEWRMKKDPSPRAARLRGAVFESRNAMKKAGKEIEQASSIRSIVEVREEEVEEFLGPSALWAPKQMESLISAKQRLEAPNENAPDEEGFVKVRHQRNRRLFTDIVARWLHEPKVRGGGDGSGGGGGGGGGLAAAMNDEAPRNPEEAALLAAEAEGAAEEEETRQVDAQALLGRHAQGAAVPAQDFNPRALRAAHRAAHIVAAAAAAAAAVDGGGGGGGDDESAFSDDDVSGGGPARASARVGQQALSEAQLKDVGDVWALSVRNRRALATLWLQTLREAASRRLEQAQAAYRMAAGELAKADEELDARILRGASIIGLTTTGAAKYRRLLESVAPSVLVVEEAAEVLEAHVLAAMVPSIEHAVLIGDHQQLRPKVETFELATCHQLNISMFERLINNGLPHVTLTTQHRMRPEFSRLLTPAIYPTLIDHPSVVGRPGVQGLRTGMFFLAHQERETSAADRGGVGGGGYTNAFEAVMAVGLITYLLRNGLLPKDIVVLVAYQAQATLVRKLVSERVHAVMQAVQNGQGGATSVLGETARRAASEPLRESPSQSKPRAPAKYGLAAVRVSTIDNYQGEEAEVVILSLVRSAPTTPARFSGFMRESNRVCVALSRARRGQYILGNAALHRTVRVRGEGAVSSALWAGIVSGLEATGELGPALPLACSRHHNRSDARSPADWDAFASAGGCHLPCGERLECGHTCLQLCHADGHEGVRCLKPCARQRPCGHPCAKRCWQECGECGVLVTDSVPSHCGHEATRRCAEWTAGLVVCDAPCERRHPEWQCAHACPDQCGKPCAETCPVPVSCPVASCPRKHSALVPCGSTTGGAHAPGPCAAVCGQTLECGHKCPAKCDECSKTEHASCSYPCERRLLCGHSCSTKHACGDPCPPCKLPCETRCEHSKCPLTCGELCAPCVEPCRVRCEHHTCMALCGEPCTRLRCDISCAKTIPCGHPCISLCGEPCPAQCRVCDPDYQDQITLCQLRDNGYDKRFVQLQDCGHSFAVEGQGLDGWMATQDTDEGGGGGGSEARQTAVQLPACPACRKPIRRSFRYAAIVRRRVLQIAEIKLRTSVGFELRGTVMTALKKDQRASRKIQLRALNYHLQDLRKRASANQNAATPRLLIGEILVRKATLEEAPNAGSEQRRDEAEETPAGHFQEALRLVGFVEGRSALEAPPAGAFPPLSERQRLIVVHLALLQIGIGMAKSGASQEEGAKRRLVAAKECAARAGLVSEVDIDAILRNADAAQAELVKSAMTGVERGSWHECPNGHRYLIGECGGAMQQSRCPDCSAQVGGSNHQLASNNRSVGQTPYGLAAQMPPNEEMIARAQRD